MIEVPFRDELTQQERYFHGAVTGAIADTAGGYAVADGESRACAASLQTVSLSPVKA